MRTASWLQALAIAAVAAIASVAADAPTAATLSASERATITNELIKWKSSPVGLEARKRGLIPSSFGIEDVTDDEISRFIRAKQVVAQLQVDQPSAVFTINTPYALLSHEEYVARSTLDASSPVNDQPATPATNATVASNQRGLVAEGDDVVVDWVARGCVTPVEHEGACSASWVFATIGTIETNYCINSPARTLYQLSKQDPLTCGINTSCYYGVSPTAFQWIASFNKGTVCTAASLPYTRADFDPQPCSRVDDPSSTCDSPDLQVASYVEQQFSDHTLLEQIVKQRSVTAIINPCKAYQYYSSGVLRGDAANCPAPSSWTSNTSHRTVQIVGLGTLDGVPYWKIKNSEGKYWGNQGYAYVERGYLGEVYGASGIEEWITYPVFKSEVQGAFDSTRIAAPRYNVELLGNTLKVVGTMQYEPGECGDICRREPGCKGYTWSIWAKSCTLLSSITGERRGLNPDRVSAAVISKDELVNGVCLPLEDNVDFPENDLYHTLASTPGECCDMCFRHEKCGAYTWTQYKGGSCYLKSRRAVTPVAKAPAPDGSVYTKSGVAYKCQPLQFNTDFVGNDLTNVPASGPMDCCSICRSYASLCAGFSWTNYNNGTCWLKSRVPDNGIGSYAAGVYAAAI